LRCESISLNILAGNNHKVSQPPGKGECLNQGRAGYNLQPHKAAAVVTAVEQAGARVVPLPPSSPDLTPIEEMYSKVKGALRAAARTVVAIYAAIGPALRDVSPQDILGWFQSRAAYAMQS
jgi:hypothetical protein